MCVRVRACVRVSVCACVRVQGVRGKVNRLVEYRRSAGKVGRRRGACGLIHKHKSI